MAGINYKRPGYVGRLARRRLNSRSNHYQALGVSRSASRAQIRSRFLELSKKYHPDCTRHLEEAEQQQHTTKFKSIKEAYDTLKSTSRRREYDASLLETSHTPTTNPYGPTRDARSYARPSTMHTSRRSRVYNYGRDFRPRDSHDPITRPFTGASDYDVPHFDFEKHYRSQRGYDEHRQRMNKQKRNGRDFRPDQQPWTLTPFGVGLAVFAFLLYAVR